MIKKQIIEKSSAFFIAVLVFLSIALAVISANALTDTTRPTILSVSPTNNERDISTKKQITVVFSEDMDSSTLNANTFIVMQRATPETGVYMSRPIEGTIAYNGRTATFTPDSESYNPLQPNQKYGNVFTVTITSGAKDLAGNLLSRNYVWSFTTGLDRFNTGASTSQSDQSSVPASGATTVPSLTQTPSATGQVAGAQVATTTNFLWVWIVGAILLLTLIALFFITRIRPADEKHSQKKNVNAKKSDPFGDVHPVMDLQGIGPEYNKKLQAMGIKNTHQLWKANAVAIAQKTGAPLSTVKSWQQMAELSSVKGIGPQYAELLVRSGINSIDELKNCEPDKLLKLVREKQESLKVNMLGNSPGHITVEHWISEARDHRSRSEA